MAEEESQEKTEQPSPKRLKESREKGQIARSKDFNATLILLFSGGAMWLVGQYMAKSFLLLMQEGMRFNRTELTLPKEMYRHLLKIIYQGFGGILPLLLIITLITVCAPVLMGGWVFSGQSLQPQFSRLSPAKGLKRIFSLNGIMETIKASLKLSLVSVVAYFVLLGQFPSLLALTSYSLQTAVSDGLYHVLLAFTLMSLSLLIVAGIDVPFQWYSHMKELKMTKQELKDEYKETEGKPEVKGAIRRMQHEIARRRMMTEIPKADVVITNPTHYAVALAYKVGKHRAPVVVAKGKDLIALQIHRVAHANDVPILRLPPLARSIYFSTKLNAAIPQGLYVAVAQVLAYLMQLKDKKNYERAPRNLMDLPIPDELRRDEMEA